MIEWRKHIVSDEKVLVGKPTIKGTRISVDHIIQLLSQGWTEKQILENYKRLTPLDLQAIFAYINDCMQDGLLFHRPKESA